MPTRYSFRLLLVLVVELLATRALAQTGGSTGTTALAESDFSIYVQVKSASGSWSDLSTSDAKTYFNSARCNCGSTVRFVVEATTTAMTTISTLLAASGADGDARLYLSQSNGCTSDPTESSYGCVLLDEVDALSSLTKNGYWISTEVSVPDLFGSSAGNCDLLKTQYVWLWIDTASDGSPDLTGDSAPSLSLRLDGKPPSPPTGLSAQGGQQALLLTWTASASASSSSSDLAGYLVFCQRGTGAVAFSTSPYDSQYVSPATLSANALCPSEDVLASTVFAATFANLDAAYLCSGLIASDQTSYRLKYLENDVEYTLVMVAVDNDGNLSTPTDAITGTPVLTVDFYNQYVNEGGQAVGGYCEGVRGAARPGALACLIFGAVMVWARKRRKRRGRWLWLIPLVGILGARPALGQAVYRDYESMGMAPDIFSDLSSSDSDDHGRSPRTMAMEFRLGPYSPDIDSGLSNGATPQQTVFGTSTRLLYQLEVDYDLLKTFGTLALGAGIGYFRESAKAFIGTPEGVSTGVRSSDETALRLIPVSLLAVYRMDVLAERWNVPLVPYAKLGLNYTFWKVTDGNGDVATLTRGGRGVGGTAGWQASAGLAFQLDILDPASMRELDSESGLNHMYAFCEYAHVDASGLGMGNRLHVGDNTWSAGLLLEF
ncbi:MAG TPA: MXAN_2562 family outer membrane beta-barrel protein [Polyangia bacterium]